MNDWKVFQGNGLVDVEAGDDRRVSKSGLVEKLPAPPWRDFSNLEQQRAATYKPPPDAVEVINAALYLRRPILVTGQPGTGKTSLIYAVAAELGLGEVLAWPINSRSTVSDGLYRYDAVARLRQARIEREAPGGEPAREGAVAARDEEIGRFIRLGPLGTAFLPGARPRALLIDEIDKSDVDLPNDLLHIFEEGRFEIPELVRISKDHRRVEVGLAGSDSDAQFAIDGGHVRCGAFPFVIITSNGERDLPPAFLRRCLRLDLEYPDEDRLAAIVSAHLGEEEVARLDELIAEFRARQDEGASLATDQLLNTVFMIARGASGAGEAWDRLRAVLLRELEAR